MRVHPWISVLFIVHHNPLLSLFWFANSSCFGRWSHFRLSSGSFSGPWVIENITIIFIELFCFYFLGKQGGQVSSFPNSALESLILPRSPGSFLRRVVLRNQYLGARCAYCGWNGSASKWTKLGNFSVCESLCLHTVKYMCIHTYIYIYFFNAYISLLTLQGFFLPPFLYNSVLSQNHGNWIFSVYLFHLTHVLLFTPHLVATFRTLLTLWHSLWGYNHSCLPPSLPKPSHSFPCPFINLLLPPCSRPWNIPDAPTLLRTINGIWNELLGKGKGLC